MENSCFHWYKHCIKKINQKCANFFGHSPVSQIATHSVHSVQYCLSACFEQSAGISSGLVALRLAVWVWVWRMSRATFERSGRGSCSQYFWSVPFLIMVQVFTIPFPPVCDLCSFSHIFASRFIDWIHCRRGWNFRVIVLTFWKSFLEFRFEFSASNSTHMPSSCCSLSSLSFLCTSAFSCWYRFLSLLFASFFSLIAAKLIRYPVLRQIQSFLWPIPAGLSWYLTRDLLELPGPVQPAMP